MIYKYRELRKKERQTDRQRERESERKIHSEIDRGKRNGEGQKTKKLRSREAPLRDSVVTK